GEWTAEALGNLLKNCADHTPPGGDIRVRCSENPLHTEIAICDSGEGIDPGDLPHLFERFYKGKNAASDGVGTGLAMAKTILQSQNADESVCKLLARIVK
ncbi:sensor histidine kinase, partial [Bittarella massiliensis (ex Durand et al. 2017)]